MVDTHALIWWLDGRARRLGRSARAFFEQVDVGKAVAYVPSIVLVELGEAMQRGAVALDEPFATFVQRLDGTPSRYRVAPLSAEIVVQAHTLYAIPERGDRLIAATASALGLPLVTRDPDIAAVIGAAHVW